MLGLSGFDPELAARQYRESVEELRRIGEAAVYLSKSAADATISYAVAGRLISSDSGYVLLTIPNALVRGAFDTIHEIGVELPPNKAGRLRAHITILRPDELKQIGGKSKLSELGHTFNFNLGPLRVVEPSGWPEMAAAYFLTVQSPQLEKLRKSYGLSALPKNNEHPFHCTIAVKRRSVTRPGDDVIKAGADKPYRDRAEMYALKDGKLFGSLYPNDTFGVYGGGIDPGEDQAEAAAREFTEESGWSVTNPRLLPIPSHTVEWKEPYASEKQRERAKEFRGSRTFYVVGDLGEKIPGAKKDEKGRKDARLYDLDEAAESCTTPKDTPPEIVEGNRRRLAVLEHLKKNEVKNFTVAIDLDGTLTEPGEWQGPDHFHPVRKGAAKFVRQLKEDGCKIIIHTCRGDEPSVKKWLKDNDIVYDHLNHNPDQPDDTSEKLWASAYVDDKGVHADGDWKRMRKELDARREKTAGDLSALLRALVSKRSTVASVGIATTNASVPAGLRLTPAGHAEVMTGIQKKWPQLFQKLTAGLPTVPPIKQASHSPDVLHKLVDLPPIQDWINDRAYQNNLVFSSGRNIADQLRDRAEKRQAWQVAKQTAEQDRPSHQKTLAGLGRLLGKEPDSRAMDRAAGDIVQATPYVASLLKKGMQVAESESSVLTPLLRMLPFLDDILAMRQVKKQLPVTTTAPKLTQGLPAAQTVGLTPEQEPDGPLKAAAAHHSPITKMQKRDQEIMVCPHCGDDIDLKDLYTDKKGWVFHRPCLRKGKGAIKVPQEKAAIEGIAARSDTVPSPSSVGDTAQPSNSEPVDSNYLATCNQPPDPNEFVLPEMAI